MLRKKNEEGFKGLVEMATLKKRLFASFLILSFIAILTAITGWWLTLLKFIFSIYIPIAQGYSAVVIVIGFYYFFVNKKKEGTILLGATLYDCAAIIATFYTGISYFHELFSNLSDFLSILSEKYMPFVLANAILLYWSLSQFFDKLRKTFYERGTTEEIKESVPSYQSQT